MDKYDHDQCLKQVFHHLAKMLVSSTLPCSFFGHVFSENGMSPDPKKVEAQNVSDLLSHLSSAAFCSRFIKGTRPNLVGDLTIGNGPD